MSLPVNGTSERLLTLLDLAKAAPSGASLGADIDDAFNGPQVAADLGARVASIAADLIAEEPSVAADIRGAPSTAADGPSTAADGAF